MQYSTVTLLDSLCLERRHTCTDQPEAVRVKTQAELCCCNPSVHVGQPVMQLGVNGHWAKYGIAVFQRSSHLRRHIVHV